MRELPLELVRRPAEFPRLHPSAQVVDRDADAAVARPRGRPRLPGEPAAGGAGRHGSGSARTRPSRPSAGTTSTARARRASRPSPPRATSITNGEFHDFVVAGGYREQRCWTEEGWRWRGFRNVKWPTFWVPCGPQGSHQYLLRTIFEVVAMPWDWPAA